MFVEIAIGLITTAVLCAVLTGNIVNVMARHAARHRETERIFNHAAQRIALEVQHER